MPIKSLIESIDHVVLTCSNFKNTIDFYVNVLGMKVEEFHFSDQENKRIALRFGNQKINLHDSKKPHKPHAKIAITGTLDICFLSVSLSADVSLLSIFDTKDNEPLLNPAGANHTFALASLNPIAPSAATEAGTLTCVLLIGSSMFTSGKYVAP